MTTLVDLADGRRAAYEVFGDEAGAPVVLLHGFSDSRLTGAVFDGAAREAGVRLVVPDRPGHGLSSGRLRSFEDAARWLAAFGDAVGLERLHLLAVSGGGPFALAAGRFAPERLARVVVVSGLGPPELGTRGMPVGQRLAIAVAARMPVGGSRLLAFIARLARASPGLYLRLVGSASSPTDAAAARRPGSVETMVSPFVEAYRQGPDGVAGELRLLLRPWSFRPEDVGASVRFEHGADDRTVPVDVARALAARVPAAELCIREGVGHFTLVPRHAVEILRAVV